MASMEFNAMQANAMAQANEIGGPDAKQPGYRESDAR